MSMRIRAGASLAELPNLLMDAVRSLLWRCGHLYARHLVAAEFSINAFQLWLHCDHILEGGRRKFWDSLASQGW